MAKVFNVDQLAEETREIVLKGVTHQVQPMNVETFIQAMKTAEELEKDGSFEAQINAVIKMVSRAIPTISEQELRALPFEQLSAISQFVRGEVPDALKGAVEPKAEGEAKN